MRHGLYWVIRYGCKDYCYQRALQLFAREKQTWSSKMISHRLITSTPPRLSILKTAIYGKGMVIRHGYCSLQVSSRNSSHLPCGEASTDKPTVSLHPNAQPMSLNPIWGSGNWLPVYHVRLHPKLHLSDPGRRSHQNQGIEVDEIALQEIP